MDDAYHLCPYSWLIWVQFAPQDNMDTVTLIFNSHKISIIGTNLRKLGLAIQEMRVETIRLIPKKNGFTPNDKIAFIENIQVVDCQIN